MSKPEVYPSHVFKAYYNGTGQPENNKYNLLTVNIDKRTNEIEYYFKENNKSEVVFGLVNTLNNIDKKLRLIEKDNEKLRKKNKKLEDKLLALEYAPPNSKFNEILENWNSKLNKDNYNN